MLGKTHIVNSAAISMIPMIIEHPISYSNSYPIYIFLIILGSIIPDIDEPSSIIGRRVLKTSTLINTIFGHRTITHNLTLVSLIAMYIYYININNSGYIFAFLFGIALHILQDSMTYQGVRNGIFPFQRLGYHFVLLPRIYRFAVGGLSEKVIFYTSLLVIFSALYIRFIA
jgi:inner membrane protein